MNKQKLKTALNKFLRLFGLMKIKTAKNLSTVLFEHYVQTVINTVIEEFKVKPAKNALPEARKYWKREFMNMVDKGYDNANIITPPKFKEDK